MKFEEIFNTDDSIPYLLYKGMKIVFTTHLFSRRVRLWVMVGDYLMPINLMAEDYLSDEWEIPDNESH